VIVSKSCYSGCGAGKNNSSLDCMADVGPIPAGSWTISGPPIDSSEHGPYVLRLEPKKGTETYGRSGFLIHGDSVSDPGNASKGCLIASKEVRSRIWQSGDYDLEVIP
jgi:hypothetical protein